MQNLPICLSQYPQKLMTIHVFMTATYTTFVFLYYLFLSKDRLNLKKEHQTPFLFFKNSVYAGFFRIRIDIFSRVSFRFISNTFYFGEEYNGSDIIKIMKIYNILI